MHSGWTIGGGGEYMFLPRWSAKAEYMYSDFASVNYFGTVVPGGIDSGRQQIHSVKAGAVSYTHLDVYKRQTGVPTDTAPR